ncbi:zf-HC2 domain-containing protein [Streptomyces sp. WAC06614]|nr:zf-HC2 domain-containing protein [Streptomyces sp. WAC06614]
MRHPDVSEISDLTEGLLSPARTAEVRRHLGECPLCADVRTSLEEIRSLLGTLPGPPRIPADIAGRIDAALAAEALLSATAPAETSETSEISDGATDRPAPAAERPHHVSRETTSSVSAPTRPAGRPRAGTGPGRGRRRAVLAGLVAAAALGLGAVLLQLPFGEHHESGSQDSSVTALQPKQDRSTFSAGGLEAQVQQLLGRSERNRSLSSTDSQPGLAPAEREAPTVPPCVQQGIGRTETPLATETGVFKGADALLVVLPHPSDTTRVDAYLVDSTCTGTPGTGPGKVLLTATYARH